MDLHRPFIDDVTFSLRRVQTARKRRIPEVMDAWYDSGAMPVAQWHYPFENADAFEQQQMADYICEGVDQTRGWFYTLHALAVLLFDRPAYKNVLSLGHILDGDGEKMSKSRGNVVEPWDILEARGADALRWYMYTASTPGKAEEARRRQDDRLGAPGKRGPVHHGPLDDLLGRQSGDGEVEALEA